MAIQRTIAPLVAIFVLCSSAFSLRSQSSSERATLQTLDAAAVKTNAVAEIQAALKANPDLVFARYPSGRTFLFYAALGGNPKLVETLLACKAEVNARDTNGLTPLHVAAHWGNRNAAAVLLANKAEVNARDNQGQTPLHLALRGLGLQGYSAQDAARLLQESQSVTNGVGQDGSIILRSKRDETIKLLFQHGAHE